MGSTYGDNFRFTIFGQSHSPAIGVTMEGLPAGLAIDFEALQVFLNRRAPGQGPTATARREADRPQFLSGLVGNVTCGAPVTAMIPNTNIRPQDYGELRDCPRPGHADFTAQERFHGFQDPAGGGHFSGRLTAPLCIAGGICLQILERHGVTVAAHIQSIGQVTDEALDPVRPDLGRLCDVGSLRVLSSERGSEMEAAILRAKSRGDSLGGVIECVALGLPSGLGDPMFGGMENRIARIVFGIPAIRGLEFGTGFAAASMTGSSHNDPFCMVGGRVRTETNHHGGILGGITSGMPLVFRAAGKPTPSIAREQRSVSLSRSVEQPLEIHGRHDPCIVPRAVPCLEAAAAIAIYDAILEREKGGTTWI